MADPNESEIAQGMRIAVELGVLAEDCSTAEDRLLRSAALIAARLAESRAEHAPPSTVDLSPLSAREREVVRALCAGKRLSAVAVELGITKHTCRNHAKNVFRKLGLHSQNELIATVRGAA